MRELKFRAKNTINGNWVYGFYYEDNDICKIRSVSTIYPVHPWSVGQFTGLLDKNGVKIFEGDIIDSKTVSFSLENATFMLGNEPLFLSHNHREIEGNIHEK